MTADLQALRRPTVATYRMGSYHGMFDLMPKWPLAREFGPFHDFSRNMREFLKPMVYFTLPDIVFNKSDPAPAGGYVRMVCILFEDGWWYRFIMYTTGLYVVQSGRPFQHDRSHIDLPRLWAGIHLHRR